MTNQLALPLLEPPAGDELRDRCPTCNALLLEWTVSGQPFCVRCDAEPTA